jgi:hypothetical protein
MRRLLDIVKESGSEKVFQWWVTSLNDGTGSVKRVADVFPFASARSTNPCPLKLRKIFAKISKAVNLTSIQN